MNISFYFRLCDMDICPAKAQPVSSMQQHQNKGNLVFITKDGTGRVVLCLKSVFGFMALTLAFSHIHDMGTIKV